MTKESDVIAREGYIILIVSWVLAVVLFYIHVVPGLVAALWFCFCVYFFRNPTRFAIYEEGQLISPADGKVVFIGEAQENHFLNKPMLKVSVFMSPFNVHVNRAPASGLVMNQEHIPGKFLAAFDPKAGDENERSAVHLKLENSDEIVFVQVAGWFARRIVTYAKKGDHLTQGRIMGLIKFGSRMDIYLPLSYKPQVEMNQMVQAGSTVLAL